MKALNPSTGNLEKVYVKALDSMPVGAEIDFDGQAVNIPVGWEEVDNSFTITPVYTRTGNAYRTFKTGKVATISGQIFLSSITANSTTKLFDVAQSANYPKNETYTTMVIRNATNGACVGYGSGILGTTGAFSIFSSGAYSGEVIVYFEITYQIN